MKDWPLKKVKVDDLIALRKNPQHLTPKTMKALQETIRKDGFLVPVLIQKDKESDKFIVLSGNHRVMAAREIGMKEVPAILWDGSEADAKKIAISLNTIHGDPDPYLLAPLLAELDDVNLQDIFLAPDLESEILTVDEELSERIKKLELPDKYDRDSLKNPVPNRFVTCPKCKHKFVPAK